jgi:hypothetical protein
VAGCRTPGRGETTWIRLANGDLFAASRTTEAKDNYMLLQGLRSKDNGATWTFEHDLTLTRQHPADLTALPGRTHPADLRDPQ